MNDQRRKRVEALIKEVNRCKYSFDVLKSVNNKSGILRQKIKEIDPVIEECQDLAEEEYACFSRIPEYYLQSRVHWLMDDHWYCLDQALEQLKAAKNYANTIKKSKSITNDDVDRIIKNFEDAVKQLDDSTLK